MKSLGTLAIVLFAMFYLAGCGKKLGLEYGGAQAQFNEGAVLEKGKPFVGKKITVKGVVTKQDLTDPENCRIYLGHSICCNLGDLQKMAESYTVGKTVFITGYLERCEEGDILLEPAVGTEPGGAFNPIE